MYLSIVTKEKELCVCVLTKLIMLDTTIKLITETQRQIK